MAASFFLSSVVAALYYRYGKWKELVLFEKIKEEIQARKFKELYLDIGGELFYYGHSKILHGVAAEEGDPSGTSGSHPACRRVLKPDEARRAYNCTMASRN